MKEKASEIVAELAKTGKQYTIWDLLSLSCITLVNACEITPQMREPTRQIVGLLIDGNIELKHTYNNGILPKQKEQRSS